MQDARRAFETEQFRAKVGSCKFSQRIIRRSCFPEAAEEEVATLQHELKKNKVDGREFRPGSRH